MRRDLLRVVETAYDCGPPTEVWLAGAARALMSTLPGVIAPIAYTLALDAGGRPQFHHAFMEGVPDARAVLERAHADVDAPLARVIFPEGTHSLLFSETLAAIGRAGLTTPASVMANTGGAGDILGIFHMTSSGHGIVIGALVDRLRLTARARTAHRAVAVHLAAGLRLRSLGPGEVQAPEAIFEADRGLGLADCRGAAASRSARDRLRDAVAAVHRARTDRGVSEGDALALWRGLVDGRWSLIDRVDHDGRRYYVAIPNPPRGIAARKLTDLESQIVSLAITGDPNKVIGYALGLAASTVAGVLARAMRKLGADSRVDLIRIGKALVRDEAVSAATSPRSPP